MLFYALVTSWYDKGRTLEGAAALWHPTAAQGCSSPLLQLRNQFQASLLAVSLLLHAFPSAYVFSLFVYALSAC